jgi:hypothetical protein
VEPVTARPSAGRTDVPGSSREPAGKLALALSRAGEKAGFVEIAWTLGSLVATERGCRPEAPQPINPRATTRKVTRIPFRIREP